MPRKESANRIRDYRAIIQIIDETFTRHERRLVELREDTIAYMRNKLTEARIPTHSTPGLTLQESSDRSLPTT